MTVGRLPFVSARAWAMLAVLVLLASLLVLDTGPVAASGGAQRGAVKNGNLPIRGADVTLYATSNSGPRVLGSAYAAGRLLPHRFAAAGAVERDSLPHC